MKTHEITTSKGEFVVVDIDDIEGIEKELQIYGHDEGLTERELQEYFQRILIRNTLICKLCEAREDDAKLVVDNYSDSKYKNYSEKQQDYPHFENPKYSLYSLIESKGIDINNGNWYLFKKV